MSADIMCNTIVDMFIIKYIIDTTPQADIKHPRKAHFSQTCDPGKFGEERTLVP